MQCHLGYHWKINCNSDHNSGNYPEMNGRISKATIFHYKIMIFRQRFRLVVIILFPWHKISLLIPHKNIIILFLYHSPKYSFKILYLLNISQRQKYEFFWNLCSKLLLTEIRHFLNKNLLIKYYRRQNLR